MENGDGNSLSPEPLRSGRRHRYGADVDAIDAAGGDEQGLMASARTMRVEYLIGRLTSGSEAGSYGAIFRLKPEATEAEAGSYGG